ARAVQRMRHLVVATRARLLEAPVDPAFGMLLDRPALHADRVGEIGAAEDVGFGQRVLAGDEACLADAELRRDLDDVGAIEPGRGANEFEHLLALPAALDLAVAQFTEVDAAPGAAVGIAHLCDVGAPLDRVFLRPQDDALAREPLPAALGFL